MGRLIVALALLSAPLACSGPVESSRYALPLELREMDAAVSDLGYEVRLTELRIAAADVRFTVSGEVHSASWLDGLLGGTAYAHPGHFQGGDVTGELVGEYIFDWSNPAVVGVADLLGGTYTGADFDFRRAQADELDAGDPLIGHTAVLRGEATRDGMSQGFTLIIDAPDDRSLIGAPFEHEVDENAEAISMRFVIADDLEGDTLFDGVDFFALAGGGELSLSESSDGDALSAYESVRRAFLSHDHVRFDIR